MDRADWILRAVERQRSRDADAWIAILIAFGMGVVAGLAWAGAL